MIASAVSERTLDRSSFAHEREALGGHRPCRSRLREALAAEFQHMLDLLGSTSAGREFLADPEIKRRLSHEPYACAFKFALETFFTDLRRITQNAGVKMKPTALSSLACWYLSRLVDASRYALHLTYSRSGLPYSSWRSIFDRPDTASQNWLEIAEEFPVLIRQLSAVTRNCIGTIQEMIERVSADRAKLSTVFGIAINDPVKQIDPGLSDPHRCGRTVMRLHFSQSGPLIYKPKPMQLDAAFHQQPAEALARMGILGLKVLALDGYGWMEHVDLEAARSSTPDPNSMARSAATFWLLNTSDLHLENIIPTLQGILALDLETLLTAPITGTSAIIDPLWRNHSIYTTLLFDFRISAGPRPRINGFDHSNAGLPYFNRPDFVIVEDAVKIVSVNEKAVAEQGTAPASLSPDHARKLVAAFGLIDDPDLRAAILRFIGALGDDVIGRVVFRDTVFYARLLERMRQPRFLRDGAELSRDLAALHKGISDASPHAHLFHRIVEDEISQLIEGDIPYFAMPVGGTLIEASRSSFSGFFASSAKAFAMEKVVRFSSSDIAEQQALIGLALGVHEETAHPRHSAPPPDEDDSLVLAGELDQLAGEISASSFRPDGSPARWMTMLGDVAEHELRIDVGDTGLFSGSLGILCALQAVESSVQIRSATRLSEFLDDQATLWASVLERGRGKRRDAGHRMLGFLGVGGQLFAFSTLARLAPHRWNNALILLDGEIEGIEAAIDGDDWFDFTMGIAGLAVGCEHFLRLGTNCDLAARVAEIQQHCARRLVEVAVELDGAIAWIVRADPKPLLSYAHGWAGIVVALAAAKDRARGAAAFELESILNRAGRYPELLLKFGRGWLDERDGTPVDRRANRSWCNGLSGFIRGVWAVHPTWSPSVAEEFERSCLHLQERLATSDSHRFCCGEFGSLDLLIDVLPAQPSRLTGVALQLLQPSIGTAVSNPERVFASTYQGRCGMIYTAARLLNHDIPSLSGQYGIIIPPSAS